MSVHAEATSLFSASAFAGRVYGITGAAHGIGEATARLLVGLGASVVLVDLHEQNLHRLQADLTKHGRAIDAEFVCADVTAAAAMKAMMQRCDERWGRLDGWVNNAMLNTGGTLEDEEEQRFVQAWQVNTLAAWRLTKLGLPLMRAAGGGSIVNISSIMAHQTVLGNVAYTSSKAALEGLTRALAVELAPLRIRVNAIQPGYICTGDRFLPQVDPAQTANGQPREPVSPYHDVAQPWPDGGRARDIAHAILYLLSETSRFVTGTTLLVDGGLRAELPAPDAKRKGDAAGALDVPPPRH